MLDLSVFHQCAHHNYLFLTHNLSVNREQGQNEVEHLHKVSQTPHG